MSIPYVKLHAVHGQKSILCHGENDAIAVTYCGKKVSLSRNRQRLTHVTREVTCRRCAESLASIKDRLVWWKKEKIAMLAATHSFNP